MKQSSPEVKKPAKVKKDSNSVGKKKSVKDLKKELWRLFSKFIRERDKHICYTCGKPGNEAGHYYHSKGYLIHFDERAVNCQCPTCNRWKSGNLQQYSLNLVRDFGPGILDEFNRLRSDVKYRPTCEEIEARIVHYKQWLRDYEVGAVAEELF